MPVSGANVSVGLTEELLTAGTTVGSRTALMMANMGSNTVFYGPTGVTVDTGFPLKSGQIQEVPTPMVTNELYGVVAYDTSGAGLNVRILESS